MTRRNWLWAVVLAVPMAVAGTLYAANTQRASGYTCPVTGENLPCEKCCPLNGAKAADDTCPLTGEALPCEECCPLTEAKQDTKSTAEPPYLCPVSGEELSCPKCCPLNKPKK